MANKGCILLGVSWLFLLGIRNNRIQGISIHKLKNAIRNTINEGDLGTIVSAHAPVSFAWRLKIGFPKVWNTKC